VRLTHNGRPNAMTVAVLVLVVGGGYRLVREPIASGGDPPRCDPSDAACIEAGPTASPSGTTPPTLSAGEACVDVGYLCAELAQNEVVRLHRWKGFDGVIVVHIPLPDVGDSGAARALQRAAAQGIRAWNGQPFEILADLRGDRDPHFSVQWKTDLGGSRIGVASTQWSPAQGLTVVSIELAMRSPYAAGEAADPRRVRLTAAHEMGHALGLPHSDSERDVMYPTNTATSMSAQDYRTIEVLYKLPDGTEIRR
jgi:hypothetical protein